MKKTYFLLLLLLCCSVSFGQGYWGGNMNLNVDVKGNYNIFGSFQDSMVFNNTVVHSGTILPVSFVAHTDSALNLKWCRLFNGGLEDIGMVSDRSGNLYLSGPCYGILQLDTFVSISTPFAQERIFLAKYDTSGRLIWSRNSTGSTKTTNLELGIDSADNIYLTSMAMSPVTFGYDTLEIPYISAFVAKFDSAGTNLWLAKMPGYKDIYDFQADPAGNSFIAGTCFGNQVCDTQVFMMHDSNSFILKCSPDGVGEWQRTVRGPISEGYSVGVGPAGNATLFGAFRDSVNFNSLSPLYQTASGNSGYAVGYAVDGTELRASRLESGLTTYPYSFKARTDKKGEINLLVFGGVPSLNLGGTHIDVTPGCNAHIIKMDSLHNVLCNMDFLFSYKPYMTLDKHDNVYIIDYGTSKIGDSAVDEEGFYIIKVNGDCSIGDIKVISSPTISTESTKDVGNAVFVQVYPNPVHDALNVTLKGNIAGKVAVRVYDIFGRTMVRQESSDETFNISMGAMAPGIYFVEAIADGGRYVTRVVKE